MKRLGLTQRVEVIEEYGERRDCLDQAWTTLLEDWGYQPVPLPNTIDSPMEYLDSITLDGLILTSGNDLTHLDGATQTAPERDQFEQAALDWAIDQNVPTLGVCRGLEFLNDYFSGTLSTVEDHVATQHPVSFETSTLHVPEKDEIGFPDEIQVNSYHDYGITRGDVAEKLVVLATAPDGTVEALTHPDHPLIGIMWHPERDTPSTELDHKLFDALFASVDQ